MSTYIVEMLLDALAGILVAFYTNSISPSNHGNTYELTRLLRPCLGAVASAVAKARLSE